MASQFFLHSCDWLGHDENTDQDERDSAPALDRNMFVEKKPGGQRHEHVNEVGEGEGNRERNEAQDIEPADETRDDEEDRSEEHTSELQSRSDLVCRLLL